MSRVFIVGAAGKIGKKLCQQLAKRSHQVSAMYRHDEQKNELAKLGATPVFGDLLQLSQSELAENIANHDCMVFTAGAGGKGGEAMTNAIDGRGLELCVDAAIKAKVTRFILVSAFPEAGRAKFISDTFENYMRVKKHADVYLAKSNLDWVIVRPGTLTDEPGSGNIELGAAISYGTVSRDDVATTLAEIVTQPELTRCIVELTSGSTPTEQAVKALIE